MGVGLAAVEEGQFVAAGQGVLHHGWPDQAGASEDEDLERCGGLARVGPPGAGGSGKTGGAGEDRELDEFASIGGHLLNLPQARWVPDEYTGVRGTGLAAGRGKMRCECRMMDAL